MAINSIVKSYLSYLYPFTKRIASDHNGILEITTTNGITVLDSKDANYSYGSLQKILEFGLAKFDFSSIQSVLILGMGGGCVIESLRNKFNFEKEVTAVEIDPQIIKIAAETFGIIPTNNLKIVCADALHYLTKTTETADLIVVDIFINDKMPVQFQTKQFANLLQNHLSESGQLLINIGFNLNFDIKDLEIYKAFLEFGFRVEVYDKVEETNVLLAVWCK